LRLCFYKLFFKPGEFSVANKRRFARFFGPSIPRQVPYSLFLNGFSVLARVLLLDACDQFRPQPHQCFTPALHQSAPATQLTKESDPMLKSFMHPSSNTKTDSNR